MGTSADLPAGAEIQFKNGSHHDDSFPNDDPGPDPVVTARTDQDNKKINDEAATGEGGQVTASASGEQYITDSKDTPTDIFNDQTFVKQGTNGSTVPAPALLTSSGDDGDEQDLARSPPGKPPLPDETPRNKDAAPVRLAATGQDVINSYRLCFGREPENDLVIQNNKKSTILGLVTRLFSSKEFKRHVLENLIAGQALPHQRLNCLPQELATWITEVAPLSNEAKTKIRKRISWPGLLRIILTDQIYIDHNSISLGQSATSALLEQAQEAAVAMIDAHKAELWFREEAASFGFEPGIFFDCDYYVMEQGLAPGENPLLHYLHVGAPAGAKPHPLFDAEYYSTLIESDAGGYPTLLQHFVAVGQKKHLSPHPLVDNEFYLATYPDSAAFSDWAYAHYLMFGAQELRSPYPLFSAHWYVTYLKNVHPDEVHAASKNPLAHYLDFGARLRIDPHENFSVAYYLAHNPDVGGQGGDALLHYARHGRQEGRATVPNRNSLIRHPLHWKHDKKPKQRIYYFLHEATRTGAPYILLRIVEYFSRDSDIENVVFIDRSGPLNAAFREVASTFELDDVRRFKLDEFISIADFLRASKDDVPTVALFNSACNAHFLPLFAAPRIPVVYLVHELANAFSEQHFLKIYEASREIVYPARFVQQVGREVGRISRQLQLKDHVIPQGLLHMSVGNGDPATARAAVRQELDLPEDAKIVLGCGTLDMRKGLDLFVNTAIEVLSHWDREDSEIFFIWVGRGPTHIHSAYYYVDRDIRNSNFEHNIRLIGERPNTEAYFRAADVMFISSREDPFPCVVHEAMASRLPVVAFENGGGAPEALDNGAGVVVPYGRVAAAAAEIADLLRSGDRRQAIGEIAAERVERKYNFDDYCENLTAFLKNTNVGPVAMPAMPRRQSVGVPVYFSSADWCANGVNSFTEILVQNLIARGMDAKIMFTHRDPVCRHDWFQPSVPYVFATDLDEHRKISIRWQQIEDFLTRHGPCIFVPNYDYVASALSPRLSSSVGIVAIAHSDHIEHYEHIFRIGRYANRIIGVSAEISRKIEQLGPEYARKLETIRYGIPFLLSRRRSSLKDRPIHLVYVGRLVQEQKRILDYVPLIEQLERNMIDFVFTFVGDGPEEPALRALLWPFIERGMVRMLGRLRPDEVRAELNNQDIFLLLSDYEGLPIAMLEAMAQGCVPIARAIGSGVPELIEHGKTGWLLGRRVSHELTDIIRLLMSKPATLISASEAAKALVEGNYSEDIMSDRYFELFMSISDDLQSKKYSRPLSMIGQTSFGSYSLPPNLQEFRDF